MSNGEQTKILLASLFLHDGAFLLIDEPTNHLDAGGRRLLGEYLAQKRGYTWFPTIETCWTAAPTICWY